MAQVSARTDLVAGALGRRPEPRGRALGPAAPPPGKRRRADPHHACRPRVAALSVAMTEHLDGGDIHVSLAMTTLSNRRLQGWSESGLCRSHRCVGGPAG